MACTVPTVIKALKTVVMDYAFPHKTRALTDHLPRNMSKQAKPSPTGKGGRCFFLKAARPQE